jgi:hypothetical protein
MNLKFSIKEVGADLAEFASLEAVLGPQQRKLMLAQAKRVEIELRFHFKGLDDLGNARGWKRTHFWARRVRANTSVTNVTDTTAEVTVASAEFRQRLFGGTIVPREAKYLAIPVIEQAAGRSPRTFEKGELRFAVDPDFGKVLEQVSTGAVFYFLRRKVVQKADPTAAPSESVIRAALMDETSRFLARARQRASQKGGLN